MNTALLKRYGKVFLVILLLGTGAYFGVDTSGLVDELKSEPVPVTAPVSPDAGQ